MFAFPITKVLTRRVSRVILLIQGFQVRPQGAHMIKGWSTFQAAWFTDLSLLENVYRTTRKSAGMVHANEGHRFDSRSAQRKRSLSVENSADEHYSVSDAACGYARGRRYAKR